MDAPVTRGGNTMIRLSKKIVALLALAFIFAVSMNFYVLANVNGVEEQTLGSYVDELRERGCDRIQVVWEDGGSVHVTWMQGNLMFARRLY